MRLIRKNVEREAGTEAQIAKLKAEGFREMDITQHAGKTEKGRPLEECSAAELRAQAKARGLEGYSSLSKDELLAALKEVV